MEEVIKKEITDKLVDSEVVVEGGDSKFTVHVISDSFAGKTIIEQHKVIYAILNKYIDVPFSRLNELDIPINVQDIINIVSREVIEWPENFMTANMDFTKEKWLLNFPFKRDKYSGELSLEFNSDYKHELLSQKIFLSKESLMLEITYKIDGGWDLTFTSPQGNGKLEFLSKSKKYQEALKFPFNIPPNHARLDF